MKTTMLLKAGRANRQIDGGQCGLRAAKTSCPAPAPKWILAGLLGLTTLLISAAEPVKQPPATPNDLFQTTNIWTIHLKFTVEQWEAMEPQSGEFPGAPRGGGPGGRGGFGPAALLAPGFLKGDQNQDGKLSPAEFSALGGKWFTEWDKEKSGQLTAEQLRAGLNAALGMTNLGPPGPGGRGPGLQGAAGKRNGMAAASGVDFQYVHADLEFEEKLLADIAVRYNGNNTFMESRNSLKHSLKIDLNKYAKGQKLAGLTKLNLHNNVNDASWMNEVLSHRLFRDAGVPAPRTAYARVFVTVPGRHDKQYFGLYSVVEDIDKHFADERFRSKKGAIFKPVTRNLFAHQGDDWARYEQTYDPKTDLAKSDQQRVIDFAKLVTSASDAEFAARLGGYLDLDEFARFMAVTVWLSTMDSILMMGQNFYVYLHPGTDKFQFLPWDLDHSFGQFPMGGSQEQREQLSIQKPWRGENRFLERVFKVEGFKKLYLARMAEFSRTLFQPERFHRQVDEIAAAIRPAVQEESTTKLARFDKVVAGEMVEPSSFGGRPGGAGEGGDRPRFGGPGGAMQPPKPIKGFVTARAASVADQLAGKADGLAASARFGGPGERGRRGERGGPGGFGPAVVLARAFMDALDADKNGKITREEFTRGFAQWFAAWQPDKSGLLTGEQLRAGINRDLAPFRGGIPGGEPGFGPPGGPPPFEP